MLFPAQAVAGLPSAERVLGLFPAREVAGPAAVLALFPARAVAVLAAAASLLASPELVLMQAVVLALIASLSPCCRCLSYLRCSMIRGRMNHRTKLRQARTWSM